VRTCSQEEVLHERVDEALDGGVVLIAGEDTKPISSKPKSNQKLPYGEQESPKYHFWNSILQFYEEQQLHEGNTKWRGTNLHQTDRTNNENLADGRPIARVRVLL
jgi:hypothetical protein